MIHRIMFSGVFGKTPAMYARADALQVWSHDRFRAGHVRNRVTRSAIVPPNQLLPARGISTAREGCSAHLAAGCRLAPITTGFASGLP